MKDSNWENACRVYFSGNSELWALRNKIKQHPAAKCISIPHMFTFIRNKITAESTTLSVKDRSILAATKLLDWLNSI